MTLKFSAIIFFTLFAANSFLLHASPNNTDYETAALHAVKDTCDTIDNITDFAQNNFFNAIACVIAATYTHITYERFCTFFSNDLAAYKTANRFHYSLGEGIFLTAFAHHLQNDDAFNLSLEDISCMFRKILSPTLLGLSVDFFINRIQFGGKHTPLSHSAYLLCSAAISFKIGQLFQKANKVFNENNP